MPTVLKDYCKINEIFLKMEYMNEVIAESEKIKVRNSEVDINLSGNITCDNINPTFLDGLLSNPVLFRVFEVSSNESDKTSPIPASQEKETKVTRNKLTDESKTKANNYPYVGICNLDIGGFLNGKKSIRETLFFENEKKVQSEETISWTKLPRLRVEAFLEEGEEFTIGSYDDLHNILGITVESIYHIPKNLLDATNFEAVIPFPRFKNKKNVLTFSSGKITSVKDARENKKKWANLSHIDGAGKNSKYSLSDEEVISPFTPPLNLKKIMYEHEHKVQWNLWRNCAMSKDDFDLLYSKMMKYRVWPVEIFCEYRKASTRKTPKGNGTDTKKSKTVFTSTSQAHYIAFLNISSLLYPGVRNVRVAGHLYSYSQSQNIKKFDADFFSFSSSPVLEAANKLKTTADKNKNSAVDTEEKKDDSGTPLINEHGLPTFIVVEFELLKPFIPKRNLEHLEEQLQTYVSLKEKIDKNTIIYDIAKLNFSTSIENIISIMCEEFKNFSEKDKAITTKPENLMNNYFNFYEFLRTRESFTKMVTTLEDKALSFVNAKFGKLCPNNENLPEIYIGLIEEMHRITNKNSSRYYFERFYSNRQDLQLFVEEAIEEEEFDVAKNYLLLKITTDKTNPNNWLNYAVFCFMMTDLDTALEASKEALSLDMHHQMGLLIFGIISATLKNITAAELAFQVLLTLYPDYVEAWLILHLLYSSIGNLEAADVAMQISLKLDSKKKKNKNSGENFLEDYTASQKLSIKAEGKYGVASFVQGMSWSDTLSWTTQLCPKNNINFRVAIMLLKLGFLEFASMVLSQNLLMPEGNLLGPDYQYYLAINSYMKGLYKSAIHHLELAVKEQGRNCFLWSLMGHCYYKMDDFVNAIQCYEFVMDSFNRPDDIHLIYMRMGKYYLKANKFYCAKKIFLNACKYSPTPRVWKGVGISCLRLGELQEAERALSEANYLDNTDPETWGYLALVNGFLGRQEVLKYCFLESKKKNLTDKNLMDELNAMVMSKFGEDLAKI